MPKASEVFIKLAKDAGINGEDERLKAVLTDPKFSEIELPDDLVSDITGNLMTLDAAKNHPDVAKAFKGQYMGTVNRDLDKILKENGLDETILTEINSEPDTLKRQRLAIAKLNEHFASKNTGGEKVEEVKEKFTKQIEELNNQISTVNQTWEQRLAEKERTYEAERFGNVVGAEISKYSYSDSFPIADVNLLVKNKVDSLGYEWKNEGGKLYAYNGELKVFENNQPVTLDETINKIAEPYKKKSDPKETEKKIVKPNEGQRTKMTFGGHLQK